MYLRTTTAEPAIATLWAYPTREIPGVFRKKNSSGTKNTFVFWVRALVWMIILIVLVGIESPMTLAQTNVVANSTLMTPEEINGSSLKNVDGIRMMSREYTNSPQGMAIPSSPDDAWVPDMSLASPAVSRAGNNVVRQTPATASNTTVHSNGANTNNAIQSGTATVARTVSGSSASGTVTAPAGKASASYHPGFQVRPTAASNPPGTPNNNGSVSSIRPVSATLPVPQTSVPQAEADSWSNAGFASSGSQTNRTIAPISPATSGSGQQVNTQTPALPPFPASQPQNVINQNVPATQAAPLPVAVPNQIPNPQPVSTAPSGNWGDQFSKPTDTSKPVEMILTSKEATQMNLSEMTIEDIRVSGLEMPIFRFNKLIKTKIGNKFDQQILEEDKRVLLQTKQFIDVTVSTTLIPDKPGYLTVNIDLTPRRVMQYIKIIGNRKFSKTNLLEEIGMKRGESRLDPYDVENGRLRIIELYKNKGYNEPHVEILRGDHPEDVGVVYLIDEGIKQKVLKTEFVGNQITSAARLHSLIDVKPGFLYIIGGDFSRQRLDEDVTKLLEYYRKLGFFDAKIDREFEEGEGYTGLGKKNAWVTVRYIVTEGPRYKIRNFNFEGNKVISNDELTKLLKVKKGEFYNQTAIEMDRIAIKFAYHDKGYVLAEIEPKQVFTDEEGFLDVRYHIVEKDRYRVSDIRIEYDGGEARTKASVILNMLDVAPGQILNGRKIRESENTMKRSGYFNDKPSDGILPTIKIIPKNDEVRTVTDEEIEAAFGPSKTKVKRPVQSPQSEKKTNDQTMNDTTLNRFNGMIIRGQMRQVPTGFSTATTNAPAIANTTTPYTGGQAAPVSSYSDTSMYNNYQQPNYAQPNLYQQPNSGYTTSGTTGNTAVSPTTVYPGSSVMGSNQTAPPINGQNMLPSNTGLYTSGTDNNGTYPQMASTMAPGFNPAGLAGVDAVFPGTQEQEALSKDLLAPGNLTGNQVRNAEVVAQIREGRTGMFQASVGVNSDYGLVGNVSLTERNFDLFRPPTSLTRADGWKDAFRGGGQIFQIQAAPGTEIQRYSVSWDVPYIFDTKNSFGVTGLYGQRDYNEWFETRTGGELRLGRQWTPRFSTTLNGSIYNVRISDPMSVYVPDLMDAVGRHNLYTAGLSGSYDTRNHPFLPSQGFVVSATGEMVMGSYQFPRASIDARKYMTLHKRWDGSGRWVLGLRSAAGWVGSDAPIFERYYGGGSMNLRGFEYREVTPRYLGTNVGIGGHFEFYNSAEMLIPVSGGDEFQLAFFLDTGTVSESIKKWDTYRVSPGFGFRISIPMLGPAPLALDFAFPVASNERDVKQVFSFTLTGSR